MYESYLQSLVLQSNRSQQGWKCKTAPFQKGGAQTKLWYMWKCSTLVDARRCKYSRGGVKLTDRSELPLSNFAPVKELAKMMGDDHLYDYHDDYRRTKERNVHFFYLLTLIITVYFKLFMQRSIIPLVWQGGRSPEPWSLSTPQPFFIVVKIIFIYNYNLIIIMIQNIISMN